MEKMTDSEVLARLIYRAYIAPDPHAPLEAEALLPFRAALDLYARTWRADENRDRAEGLGLTPFCFVRGTASGSFGGPPRENGRGDSCPAEVPEAVPETDTEQAPDLDGFEPVPLRAHDTHTHTQRRSQ